MVLPKDFIETPEGLVFAVVDKKPEDGRVLCFLRYHSQPNGWQKLSTDSANRLLTEQYPHYLYFSKRMQASLHAVPEEKILVHHQPRQRLQQLLALSEPDPLQSIFREFCHLLQQKNIDLSQVGVTGSLLIGAQNAQSDIDLVFYCRDVFHQARNAIRELQQQGLCQSLSQSDWCEAWQRRDCELTLAEYVAAEQRKYNKVIYARRKVDLSLMALDAPVIAEGFAKQGAVRLQVKIAVRLQVKIKDDDYAFDYPAVYELDHEDISQILCFTATYHGHAQKGEWVEVSGQLEISKNGEQRVIVGSSREAKGEYIRVVKL